MKRILISLLTVMVTAGAVAGGTLAVFSDSETSAGNILIAGAIDLTVDSFGSTYNNEDIFDSDFPARDLTDEKFFTFGDIKPGDFGWRHISLHVNDNPGWACLFLDNKEDDENGVHEPEVDAGDTTDDGVPFGELSENIEVFAWEDLFPDGKYDPVNETALMTVPDSFFDVDVIPYADSGNSIGHLTGFGDVRHVSLAWCAGTITVNPGGSIINPGLPGSTIECDGSGASNIAQSDEFIADLVLYGEQHRNNENFLCSDVALGGTQPPAPTPTTTMDAFLGSGTAPNQQDAWRVVTERFPQDSQNPANGDIVRVEIRDPLGNVFNSGDDNAAGQFQVDSFFDVFFDITVEFDGVDRVDVQVQPLMVDPLFPLVEIPLPPLVLHAVDPVIAQTGGGDIGLTGFTGPAPDGPPVQVLVNDFQVQGVPPLIVDTNFPDLQLPEPLLVPADIGHMLLTDFQGLQPFGGFLLEGLDGHLPPLLPSGPIIGPIPPGLSGLDLHVQALVLP